MKFTYTCGKQYKKSKKTIIVDLELTGSIEVAKEYSNKMIYHFEGSYTIPKIIENTFSSQGK